MVYEGHIIFGVIHVIPQCGYISCELKNCFTLKLGPPSTKLVCSLPKNGSLLSYGPSHCSALPWPIWLKFYVVVVGCRSPVW